MKIRNHFILSVALLTIGSVSAQAAQLASAKVVEVVGSVFKYTPDGKNSPLEVGEIVQEGVSISATALSTAKLVFSNGSEVTIEENTSIAITELKQDPFSGGKSYEQLQADPSKSQVLIELNFGRLSGHTKKLQSNSSFEIETLFGTAAIRGTRWSAMLIYNAAREEFTFTITNIDGAADIISNYDGSGNVDDKIFDSSLEETREAIPTGSKVVLRLRKTDPFFDVLFDRIKNDMPTGPQPVITPDPGDDFGIIVVSPEGAERPN